MIGRLNGLVAEKQPPLLLLEVAGVGYEVQMPMTSFYKMPELGQNVIIYTHFVVREDGQLITGQNPPSSALTAETLMKWFTK